MHLIHNERVKLRATFLNTFGVGMILGAALVPTLTGFQAASIRGVGLMFLALIVGFGSHWLARHELNQLRGGGLSGPRRIGPPKSAIVAIKRKSRFGDAPDLTPEEHQRRGEAADALWRELVRRATAKGEPC